MKKRIIAFLIIIGLALKTVSVYAASNNSSDKTKAPNETIIRIKEPEVWPEVKIIHPGEEGYTYP